MMHPRLLSATLALAITSATIATASATSQICDYRAPEQWRPKTEIETLAKELGAQMGFKTFFVQPDGGCWGVYARTPEGARIEILLDPMTRAVVRQGRS